MVPVTIVAVELGPELAAMAIVGAIKVGSLLYKVVQKPKKKK